ncbi:MAG TPA: hypothetical protein PLJ21_04855 [Pseudobdellovibrionaceae bacterium]|nr:hypothetical protein [Pseudobdellovibrionaceae bacterium]
MNQISAATALNPGSQLWIIPNSENSPWTLKIDYYLNFLILKNLRHKPTQLDLELKNTILQTEIFSLNTFEKKDLPVQNIESGLLIYSENSLPNQWTYYLPFHKNPQIWIQKIHKTWQGLKQPSLRFFLPIGLSFNELEVEWKALTEFTDITIVSAEFKHEV